MELELLPFWFGSSKDTHIYKCHSHEWYDSEKVWTDCNYIPNPPPSTTCAEWDKRRKKQIEEHSEKIPSTNYSSYSIGNSYSSWLITSEKDNKFSDCNSFCENHRNRHKKKEIPRLVGSQKFHVVRHLHNIKRKEIKKWIIIFFLDNESNCIYKKEALSIGMLLGSKRVLLRDLVIAMRKIGIFWIFPNKSFLSLWSIFDDLKNSENISGRCVMCRTTIFMYLTVFHMGHMVQMFQIFSCIKNWKAKGQISKEKSSNWYKMEENFSKHILSVY